MIVSMIELSDKNFEKEISNSSKPVLVDFYTAWCPPCKILSPILEKLAEEFKDKIIFFKIDIDNNPIVSQKFGIESIPTVVLFKNGEVKDGFIGVRPEPMLKEWLEKNSTKDDDAKIENLIKEYQALAEKKGIRLNNKEMVKSLIRGLLENEKKYGARYCPCRRVTGKKEEDISKICPCQFLEKEIEEKGQCLCGLFVK
jgi:thioredoxin 1